MKVDCVVFTDLYGSFRACELLGSSSYAIQFLYIDSQYKNRITVQRY